MKYLALFILIFALNEGFAQDLVRIYGQVTNSQGEALENVNVKVLNSKLASTTNNKGFYTLNALGSSKLTLSFSLTGFITRLVEVFPGDIKEIRKDITLQKNVQQLGQVDINASQNRPGNMQSINGGLIHNTPTASGNFESILKTLPGVSSNNELSSQYSVRGGNFDENLIYINDIEIFRPLLVRNGQQEGLSFINPELVGQANFSAGGFESRYGDKLSSVLDVKYIRPDSQQVILSGGLLGWSGTAKLPFRKGYTLFGIREKTNQSILKTQPVTGSYQPKFYDIQLYHLSQLSKKLDLAVFADYNLSRFDLIPESRETTFGTISEQYKLKVDYEGQERDKYESFAGALTFIYKPATSTFFKWINSVFDIQEQENFDVEGQYVFDELETDESVADFGKVRAGRGFGVDYGYARNLLKARIYSTELRAYYQKGRSFWEMGSRFQYDEIKDKLNEYYFTDSAGYTLPYNSNGPLLLSDVVYSNNRTSTQRLSGFVQNTYRLSSSINFSAGLRGNYNSYTGELFFSPRISTVYKPDNRNIAWRVSAGVYNQPPFYRELRDFSGNLNPSVKAQKSLHFLAGADYSFSGLGSRLRFSSELYFKKLNNLIPYKIENLRIRYFAGQQAEGYAAGADFSLSGEFVEGLESMFRLSIMKTAEDIEGDYYFKKDTNGNSERVEPGYLKRPTDQRINFSAFFQDKLFNSPTYKVHLTLLYGAALPVGPPKTQRYADVFKIPSYRRADIGFSKNFLEGGSGKRLIFLKKYLESLQAYAEVFNLLNINNTVSYLWIKDVNNNQFAIPNYLTSRQLNFKIIAKFKNR